MDHEIDVFFSYSHADSSIARDLASHLEGAGLVCFIAEKDISAGDLWEPRIRDVIREAKSVLLLITPRSKNSLWVAAEAGAAWAYEKNLVACLMFVEPHELIEPIRKHQARRVETQGEIDLLLRELAPSQPAKLDELTGQWVDPVDGDTAYFRQVGTRVTGFYDYGSGTRKVGVYRGTIKGRVLTYRWRWLERSLSGQGQMTLSKDGQKLVGEWWHAGTPEKTEAVRYNRMLKQMPDWLNEEDFKKDL